MPNVPSDSPPRRLRVDRDLVVAGSALFVSLCALGVSLVQTRVMMSQRDASVWPRLSAYSKVYAQEVVIGVKNAGVGPAQVRYAQLRLGDFPVQSLKTLLDSAPVPPDANLGDSELTYGNLTGSVFAVGDDREIFRLKGASAPYVAQLGPRVSLVVCYCSVFDRCWEYRATGLNEGASAPSIQPVAACTNPPGALF